VTAHPKVARRGAVLRSSRVASKPPHKARIEVTVGVIERVIVVLKKADVPVSRSHILRALAARGHGTNSPRLHRALQFLFDQGMAIEGSKGVQWTHTTNLELLQAAASAEPF